MNIKLLGLGIGALSLAVIPAVAVVSCSPKTNPEVQTTQEVVLFETEIFAEVFKQSAVSNVTFATLEEAKVFETSINAAEDKDFLAELAKIVAKVQTADNFTVTKSGPAIAAVGKVITITVPLEFTHKVGEFESKITTELTITTKPDGA